MNDMNNMKNEIKWGLLVKDEYEEDFYGDVNELAIASFGYIRSDLSDIKNSYIRLGFHLHEMYTMRYFKDLGYSDFYECVEANFGLDKSAVSRCMNVWRRFCRETSSGTPQIFLDEKYSDYNYSQLCEMLPLSDNQLCKVNPDMTVREIREFKKNGNVSSDPVEPVATSQQKNILEYDDLMNLHGIALNGKLRSVESLDSIVLYLVDDSGKQLLLNRWCDLLFDEKINPAGAKVMVLRVPYLDDYVKAYMNRITKNKKKEED